MRMSGYRISNRVFWAGVVLAASGIVSAGQIVAQSPLFSADTLRTKRLEIVDKSGRVRAVLSTDDLDQPKFTYQDALGQSRPAEGVSVSTPADDLSRRPQAASDRRNNDIRSVQAWMKTIANAAQAYRVRHGVYPTAFRGRDTKGSAAVPPADFIGPQANLTELPSGPRGVTYGWETIDGQFLVIAHERDQDVFGTGGQSDVATLHLTTLEFHGL